MYLPIAHLAPRFGSVTPAKLQRLYFQLGGISPLTCILIFGSSCDFSVSHSISVESVCLRLYLIFFRHRLHQNCDYSSPSSSYASICSQLIFSLALAFRYVIHESLSSLDRGFWMITAWKETRISRPSEHRLLSVHSVCRALEIYSGDWTKDNRPPAESQCPNCETAESLYLLRRVSRTQCMCLSDDAGNDCNTSPKSFKPIKSVPLEVVLHVVAVLFSICLGFLCIRLFELSIACGLLNFAKHPLHPDLCPL